MHEHPLAGARRSLAWFEDARFGMFVHWGLYSLAARHEWVQSREEQTAEEYHRYVEHFDPVDADIGSWVRSAREAGMQYVVLTAKHHDGFCLWDTSTTTFCAPHTPWGRDAVAEFVAACRSEGVRIGLYYSLIDWHHPDFVIDELHPERNRDALARNARREMSRYREYMVAQLTELLTGYGQIDYLFFDYSYPDLRTDERFVGKGAQDWDSERLLALCRDLQPDGPRRNHRPTADSTAPGARTLDQPGLRPRSCTTQAAVDRALHQRPRRRATKGLRGPGHGLAQSMTPAPGLRS